MQDEGKGLARLFRRSDMLCIGAGVASRLGGARLGYDGHDMAFVAGSLSLQPHSKIEVPCRIEIPLNWKSWPPSVTCTAGWIRHHIDWHVYPDGSLCYVLPDEWRDRLRAVSRRHDSAETISYAAQYLVRNTKWLVHHHWEGHRQGITEWQWRQWRHFENGLRQYREEQYRAHLAVA